jgi:hypothetical protein
MQTCRTICAVAVLAAAMALPASAGRRHQPPGTSPQNLTVAVIPAQYFSADADSAGKLTDAVRQDFSSKGWNVLPQDTVRTAWDGMGLKNGVHYPDRTAIELGQKLSADLVVYPRLLALGIPIPASNAIPSTLQPAAVVHIRVMNVKRNRAIYFNQIAQEYTLGEPFTVAQFQLPGAVAQQASSKALVGFFERVAGTREVLAPEPPAPRRGRGAGRHRMGRRAAY